MVLAAQASLTVPSENKLSRQMLDNHLHLYKISVTMSQPLRTTVGLPDQMEDMMHEANLYLRRTCDCYFGQLFPDVQILGSSIV